MNKSYNFSQCFESLIIKALVGLFSILPIAMASKLCGTIAGRIGPFLSVSRKVGEANLRLAMPDLSVPEQKKIIKQVWINLGQTAAELANLRSMKEIRKESNQPGYILQGWEENVAPYLIAGKPAIFFTGHLANWEIMPIVADSYGMDFGFMYRAASNPIADNILKKMRRAAYASEVKMFPKGASGGKAAYAHLSRGGVLGLLVDQKLDTGLPVPFFGKTAMTMDALASFSLKFSCPVFPIHARRLGPARLEIICDKQLSLPQTGDKQEDILSLTKQMNETLECWIKQAPGDWLWLHKRWPKSPA